MWFLRYASGQTNKQTYKHADHNTREIIHHLTPEVRDIASFTPAAFYCNYLLLLFLLLRVSIKRRIA